MPEEKKAPVSPTTIAALLAGLGLGAGTEIVIRPSAPEEPGWACTVMSNNDVLCKPDGQLSLPPDDLIVHEVTDAGTPDAGSQD